MTANALTRTEIKFTRKAISWLKGIIEKILPMIRKRGLPGGCGTPSVCAVAINSPQSQNDTVGAIVS